MANFIKGIQFQQVSLTQLLNKEFDRIFNIFSELFLVTSGDVNESLDWLRELHDRFNIFTDKYNYERFLKDLENKGIIKKTGNAGSSFESTAKLGHIIRESAFQSIFGKLKKSGIGRHRTKFEGKSQENADGLRPFEFGDSLSQINPSESLKNALIRNGLQQFEFHTEDLITEEKEYQTQCSIVLMIDISHSMILYGEDRITPAKKVSLALAHLIRKQYPKDRLDIVVFGDDSWQISLADIPYLQVGPYHTNTVAGLELALSLLNKSRSSNKHIMMITDGKPSCVKRGKEYYKNAYGLDPYIVAKTLALAKKCKKQQVEVTTFMVCSDPYLLEFVERFTKEANGNSFLTDLENLGEQLITHYTLNRKK